MTKYIFITGGVVSGLGKGLTAASLGRLLKARGLSVMAQKLDPYINVDPGTMSPFQHGEVFVTEDGAETDLDLGHYERFIDIDLNKYSNLTTGKVYWNVLNKERRGEYLGETIQVIPHITNEIKSFIYNAGGNIEPDIMITEIGGTAGDIESQPFFEAIRQVSHEVGPNNSLFIHVTLVPYLESSNEHKTKPTQHAVSVLQSMGINPHIIVLRSDVPIEDEDIFTKVSLFCNVKRDSVFENKTIPNIYDAPLMLERQHFSDIVLRELNIEPKELDMSEWNEIIKKINNRKGEVNIAIVGKYVRLHDAYLSVTEAISHASFEVGVNVNVEWIDSEDVHEGNVEEVLAGLDGVIVPGGFGMRGIEGKIETSLYARENNIPYLGICLGMQIASIDFARNVLGYKDANSTEFDKDTKNPVIYINEESPEAGEMRLGSYPCKLLEGSKIKACYGKDTIGERHRHRYQFNNKYREEMEAKGFIVSATSDDGKIVEAIEVKDNDFFVAVQYHPEFKSRPNRPHPLFTGLLRAAIEGRK